MLVYLSSVVSNKIYKHYNSTAGPGFGVERCANQQGPPLFAKISEKRLHVIKQVCVIRGEAHHPSYAIYYLQLLNYWKFDELWIN